MPNNISAVVGCFFLRHHNHQKSKANSCEASPFDHPELVHLIRNRLAFTSSSTDNIKGLKKSFENKEVAYITSELHHLYEPYAKDFGPVNLGILHRFCTALSKRLAKDKSTFMIYCFQPTIQSRANACFLLAGFMILNHGWSVKQASAVFQSLPFLLKPFRDATITEQDFDLHLHDCISGLERALQLGWYDQKTFSLTDYERLSKPCSGYINVVCPKFVAFKGPLLADSPYLLPGEIAFPPSKYLQILLQLGVTCVVRLNEQDTYDRYGSCAHFETGPFRDKIPAQFHLLCIVGLGPSLYIAQA